MTRTRPTGEACRSLPADVGGATTIEYALLASLLAIGAFAALTGYGGSLANMYSSIVDAVLAVAPAKP